MAIVSDGMLLCLLVVIGLILSQQVLWDGWLAVRRPAWMNDDGRQTRLRVSFRDANEITPGALVRMMGTEIGYVERIGLYPQNAPDHVELVIRTAHTAAPIPNGARATILFTGLAGSKSVEIDPHPRPRENNPGVAGGGKTAGLNLDIDEPIRIHQAVQFQVDIAEALKGGAENFGRLLGNPDSSLQQDVQRVMAAMPAWMLNATSDRMPWAPKRIDAATRETHHGLLTARATMFTIGQGALDTLHGVQFISGAQNSRQWQRFGQQLATVPATLEAQASGKLPEIQSQMHQATGQLAEWREKIPALQVAKGGAASPAPLSHAWNARVTALRYQTARLAGHFDTTQHAQGDLHGQLMQTRQALRGFRQTLQEWRLALPSRPKATDAGSEAQACQKQAI